MAAAENRQPSAREHQLLLLEVLYTHVALSEVLYTHVA